MPIDTQRVWLTEEAYDRARIELAPLRMELATGSHREHTEPRQRSVGGRWLARQLPALREELQRQRDFRNEQLAHLVAHDANRNSLAGYGPHAMDVDAARALDEVRALVIAGARHALADIELALARMNDGKYGRCRFCEADIPSAVLIAIPKTTLCLACQARTSGPHRTCRSRRGHISGRP